MALITWRTVEAGEETPARRQARAAQAAGMVAKDYGALEDAAAKDLITRLQVMRRNLRTRILGQLTDFQRFSLQSLLRDVDTLLAEAMAAGVGQLERPFGRAASLGEANVVQPLEAAQLRVGGTAMPGYDQNLVQAAFGNAVDLLTPPMQQFATETKVAIRRVALAGENRHVELQRLQKQISGAGFENAAYRAERIIRTEMARVFNEATYARLLGQAKEFPFLRKAWRATKDKRTRLGHIEAGQNYGKGKGILIGQPFLLNVYDERGKGAPKKIGVARLRFPVDPQASPAGRIAAGATIQCRCNAFVDMDLVAFTEFTRSQVTMALGGVNPPAPPPPPPVIPAPPPVRRGPKPTAKPTVAKLKAPKPVVPVGLPAARVPDPTAAARVGPAGPKVSAGIEIKTGVLRKQIQAALAEIDKVHGDGVLPKIPANLKNPRAQGAASFTVERYITGPQAGIQKARNLEFSKEIMRDSPMMAVFHETGHFLDFSGIGGDGYFATESGAGPNQKRFTGTPQQQQKLDSLMAAMRNSKSVQVLKDLHDSITPRRPGDAFGEAPPWAPSGISLKQVDYMLESAEVFARGYAQYVAKKSGNPAALAELRNLQAAQRPLISRDAERARKHYGMGRPPAAGTWDYPWSWEDDDFEGIERAFDDLFAELGWRK